MRPDQLAFLQEACPPHGLACAAGEFRDGRQKGEACPILYRTAWRLEAAGTVWLNGTGTRPLGSKDPLRWGQVGAAGPPVLVGCSDGRAL